MGSELALLAGALLFPLAGTQLSIVAAVVAVTETLRGLAKYLRAPARPVPAPISATAPAPFSAPTSSVPERR
jgi:hypothetical protein